MGATRRVSCPVGLWGLDGQRWVFSHTNHFGSSTCFFAPPPPEFFLSNQQEDKVDPQHFKLCFSVRLLCLKSEAIRQLPRQCCFLINNNNTYHKFKYKLVFFIVKKKISFLHAFFAITKQGTNSKCQTVTEESFFILGNSSLMENAF